jgi:hypothetical protein
MAETVIKPKGGTVAFFEIIPMTCLKLQKESGYCGYISNMFIVSVFIGLKRLCGLFSEIKSGGKDKERLMEKHYTIFRKSYTIHTSAH